jgi:hypothetical protein
MLQGKLAHASWPYLPEIETASRFEPRNLANLYCIGATSPLPESVQSPTAGRKCQPTLYAFAECMFHPEHQPRLPKFLFLGLGFTGYPL